MKTKAPRDVAQPYELEIVANEHGGYYARVPAFPTIFTGGATPAEALASGREAIELMIEERQAREQ